MRMIKEYFKDWHLFEKAWIMIFTVLVVGLSIYWRDTVMGILCSLTGIWCVVLTAKGRISNYWIGIINVVLYAFISYGYQYYGEVMLNALYFFPMQFIGAYIWIKNKKENTLETVKVLKLTNKQRVAYAIIAIVGTLGYSMVLKMMGGSLPLIDSMSTVFSVVAMILMAKRYMEQWILWIVVDVVTIVMWVVVMIQGGNDISVLLMWVAYLGNAFYGLFNWLKMLKEQED